MDLKRLQNIIQRFPKARVLVVGDLILDEYIWGSVERISPEAPVPVVWAKKKTYVPGGAANVAYNISSLGAEACLLGVIGKDKNREILLGELKKKGIASDGIIVDSTRHTTVKTRVIAGHQQVVRVDWEHVDPLSKESNRRMEDFAEKNIADFDALIIEDYGKGVINMDLLVGLTAIARRHKKIITVDPKEDHFQYYRGVSAITPNRKELENAIRNLKVKDTSNKFRLNSDRLSSDHDIDIAAKEIIEYLGLDSLLVTLGEEGMRLVEKGQVTHIPTVAQEVFDVSGAGDTVIAAFTLGLCAGAAKKEAAYIANVAAGIVVGKVGTAVTSCKEIVEKLKGLGL